LTVHWEEFKNDGPSQYNPPPSQDPWYKPPENWESAAPGTVFKTRPHAYSKISPSPIANISDVFQILFRSTDSNDNATWGVTTLFLPAAPCDKSNPTAMCDQRLVSYQIPYDTAFLDASPSYNLQTGEPWGEMALMLRRGWWVSVTDYEGPLASYGANIVAGHMLLDSLRAILNVGDEFGFRTNGSRLALWGYSNGAAVTELAIELAGTYAPKLNIAGAVLGGLVPAPTTASGPTLDGTGYAGFIIQGLLGITSQYPENRKTLVDNLNPSGPIYNASNFLKGANMGALDALAYYEFQNITKYFRNGTDFMGSASMLNMFVREIPAGWFGTPKMPVFHYHAIDDGMTLIQDVEALVNKFCQNGGNILLHRNQVGDHMMELVNGRQRALDYLGHLLDKETPAFSIPSSGCDMVTLNFTQDASKPFH
jgi:hypothetical protein